MSDNKNTPIKPNFTGGSGAPKHFREKAVLRDAKGTLLRVLTYLAGYRRRIAATFCCAVASTAVTIVGTRLSGYTVDHFIAGGNVKMLGVACVCMAVLYAAGIAAGYAQNFIMIRVAQKTAASIRRDLFAHVQRLPLAYFDTRSSGDVMSRLTNDVDNVNTAISQTAVQLFTSAVSIAGMLAAMLLTSPILTLVCLVTVPMTFFASKAVVRYSQKFFDNQQSELGQLNGYAEEMVSGQKVVQLMCREQHVIDRFRELNRKYMANSFKAQASAGVIGPSNNMINNIAYLLVAVAGASAVLYGVGGITVGVVFSFLLYMRNFTNPINNILTLANTLQLALASAERVFETLDELPERDAAGAQDIENITGDVKLENVDFSYAPGKPVLRRTTIDAEPGQTVAIVGETGAGKTTIISLLSRFYDICGGQILIDGRPIEGITRQSLRRSISLVLQDTFLFSDTIMENIRFGRLTATDEDVREAARQAYAHDFITRLPCGYDTILSDNGQNLSQGQRQLLNVARAIISQVSVLILDEATSSVDARTERIIQKALLELMRGKTSFVIAHRLSTIRNADKIVVMEQGEVVEQGSHGQLLARNGAYARMYDSQFHAT